MIAPCENPHSASGIMITPRVTTISKKCEREPGSGQGRGQQHQEIYQLRREMRRDEIESIRGPLRAEGPLVGMQRPDSLERNENDGHYEQSVRCFALFRREMRMAGSAAGPHAEAWQFGTGRATNGREKNSSTNAPPRFPTPSCWPYCCAPALPDTRRSIWRGMCSRAFIRCASSSPLTGSDFAPSLGWDLPAMRNCRRRWRRREDNCRRLCAPARRCRVREPHVIFSLRGCATWSTRYFAVCTWISAIA